MNCPRPSGVMSSKPQSAFDGVAGSVMLARLLGAQVSSLPQKWRTLPLSRRNTLNMVSSQSPPPFGSRSCESPPALRRVSEIIGVVAVAGRREKLKVIPPPLARPGDQARDGDLATT